jgi:hypothetical protein
MVMKTPTQDTAVGLDGEIGRLQICNCERDTLVVMDLDDLPVVIFHGPQSEVIFLKTLLESRGIEAAHETWFMGVHLTAPETLRVRGRDAARARELVEDFERNGKRSL